MKSLKRPQTNIQEVLLELIAKGEITFFDFAYMQGFRTRISELSLKYGLNIHKSTLTAVNKFGNTYRFTLHKLPKSDRKNAIKLYKSLTNGRM